MSSGWEGGTPLTGQQKATSCPYLASNLVVFEGAEACGRGRCCSHAKIYCRARCGGERVSG